MTPFDAKSDAVIKDHLNSLGFTVHLGPAFEGRKAGSGVDLTPDQLFDLVVKTYRSYPPADAIYFQGATMDPLPIIQTIGKRIERAGHRQQSGDVLECAIEARREGFGERIRQIAGRVAGAVVIVLA